jgi:hypothetical protein
MKALRSPWFSCGLGAVAVAFVGYQLFGGLHGRSRAYAGPVEAAVPAAAPPPQSSSAAAGAPKTVKAFTGDGMERQFIGLHFTNWTETGKRDPFLLRAPVQANTHTNGPSQLAKLKLKAIWNQTGSRVAVLNDNLYQEGDSVEGYKIIRIEDEVVWLQNANSLDHLEFRKPEVPTTAATNGSKSPSL